jgi:hypothetical protein
MIGFGIDLGGYTAGKTAFAAARWRGERVEATLFSNSVFSTDFKHQTNAPLVSATWCPRDTRERTVQRRAVIYAPD